MLGSILGAVSGIAGIAGGLKGGKTESAPTSGYATYPQWLKDLYEKTYAPAVKKEFEREYEALPMVRYDNVDPVFGSAALSALQRASDAQGGMFGPYIDPNAAPSPATTATGGATPEQIADIEARMMARQFLDSGMAGNSAMLTTNQARRQQMYDAGMYEGGLSDIGKYVMKARELGIDPRSSAAQDKVGNAAPEILQAYFAALNAPQRSM